MELASLFRGTGGSGFDYASAADIGEAYLEPDSEYLRSFQTPFTGANGGGPILNANANLLPTQSDQFRDIANSLDYRLGDGLGVARPFRKNDSMGGSTPGGFYGPVGPTKMFGRDSSTPDLNYERERMLERSRASFKKLGFKPEQQPDGAFYQPWEWNNTQALGIGGPEGNPNQYNRNYSLPDADAVARRLYQPAPSRATKMLSTDTEVASLAPQRTLMHPLKVVTEDRQREKLQRIPRNTDVMERVSYGKGEVPRGMGSRVDAPLVWGSSDVLRQVVGSNETADRSVLGRWNNGFSQPLQAVQNEDRARVANFDHSDVQDKLAVQEEERRFLAAEARLRAQAVPDPTRISVRPGDFPRDASGPSQALRVPRGMGRLI
jgi:hypothetical protein